MPTATRTRVPFLVTSLLFAQFTLAYVVQAAGLHEPWPALLLPGFGKVQDTSKGVESTRVEVELELADGVRMRSNATRLLAEVPQSMHVAVLRQLRAMPEFSPDIQAWLLAQARADADADVDALELRWIRETRPAPGQDGALVQSVEEVRRVER
jgi:hypothetical protein